MSFPMVNLENKFIPLEEIKLATEDFQFQYEIAESEYSTIYKGQLSESRENQTATFKRFVKYRCDGKKEFLNELKIISNLNHETILPFLGYCDEDDEMIIVYKYPVNDILTKYVYGRDKNSCLTWQHRLEICMDAARGLKYLHSGLGHETVICGSFTLNNILLDDNLKAKICGFEISELIPSNQPCQQVYKPHTIHKKDIDNDGAYIKDPIYIETGFLTVESDIYSFGVLLLCMFCSPQAFNDIPSKEEGGIQKNVTMKLEHNYQNRLDSVINPAIRDQIGSQSFRMIEEITCKCLSYDMKDRPTMDTLVKTFEDALDIHKREAISIKGSLGGYGNLRQLYIPMREMDTVGRRSNRTDSLEEEVSKRWPNRTIAFKYHQASRDRSKAHMFDNELEIVSKFHHENIIPFLGYCDEVSYKVLIYEKAFNGSLHDHIKDQDKLRCMPWEQRLKICLGAARGLKCLHSGLWDENKIVVHRQVRSEYILLDDKMEAKISEFGLAVLVPRNKSQVSDNIWGLVDSNIEDFKASMDPIYKQSNIVNTEVDVYSFGLVMFEILSGVSLRANECSEEPDLIRRVHRHYGEKDLDKLIDPNITGQIHGNSLQTFAETAYKCLSCNIKERPSMNRIIKKIEEALYFQKHGATTSTTTLRSHKKLEDLFIPFEEIKLATCDFRDQTGKGAFGVVYKGRLSESRTKHEAAFKRLRKTSDKEKNSDKEKTEFLKELKLISMFHHQNIIRLIGYCDDGDEMILVSEYAKNGSLDDYLEDPKKISLLTWNERLKICLGAAKGLDYLHSGLGEDNKVIHRDVKSGNILLDDNLEAKICDFGLSKAGLEYHQQSKHYTGVAGTNYYLDPIYHESGILRTDSDVYSFGVVMFEMLCGMPAYHRRAIGDDKKRPLINLVRRYYDYGKHLLVDPKIAQMDENSFRTFIDIAYQCISFNSKERPTMEMIADKIEEALDFQVKKDVSGNGD